MLTVALVAFGNDFIRRAHNCIACLKAPGNLPDVESRLMIYTDQPEQFAKYTRERKITIWPISVDDTQKHAITSRCFRHAFAMFGDRIVTIAADMLCAAGTLQRLASFGDHTRLVMVPVVRADEQQIVPYIPVDNGRFIITNRLLVHLALRFMHTRMRERMFWNQMPSVSQPTMILRWSRGCLVARCFHMHPLMVRPDSADVMTLGIDRDMVNNFPDDSFHIVKDSDELFVCDASAPDYNWETGWTKVVDPMTWVKRKTNRRHRQFFQHECLIHAEDIDASRIERDESLDRFAEQVLELDRVAA